MFQLKQRLKRLLLNLLALFILITCVVILCRLWPHPHLSQYLNIKGYSTVFLDRHGEFLRMTNGQDERFRLWTPLDDIPITLQEAILLHEDQHFYYHPGFNPISLIRGAVRSYFLNQRMQGGSTITMQLARMHWQLNTRDVSGKLVQILRSIQLELFYSKAEILEAYLNYAPYGRNIESVGAASLIYFNKSPTELNLPEALTLAVLPQSPSLRLKDKHGLVGDRLLAARNRLYERWLIEKPEDKAYQALFRLPLKLRQPEQLPFYAPHLTDMLILEAKKNNETVNQSQYLPVDINNQVRMTSVDLRLQLVIEEQVNAFIRRYESQGIKNASVILLDTRDMEVNALIGSANYFDKEIKGQVNGVLAKRSPGSTLKPFIYALALDQGVLHPNTILRDVPTQFGAYSPENFDLKFLGPISTTKALNTSRNIPAVTVATQLKNPDLYQFLQSSGIKNLAAKAHYGLALVLGGGEVTMEELASLYAILTNQGVSKPLKYTHTVTQNVQHHQSGLNTDVDHNEQILKKQLLSPAAAFITMDMLKQHQRPGDTLAQAQAKVPVFWKTGTSWGFRDAWTAGVFGPYVLIVWEGNFTGEGNNAFIGVEAAAPLFFNIVDSIKAQYPKLPPTFLKPPSTVKKVEVCLASGFLPTKWCDTTGYTWFIPGVSPIKADTIFRPVMIDNKTGEVACPPYDPINTSIQVFEYWPSDLALAFARAGVSKKTPPKSASCNANINYASLVGEPPRITSPQKNIRYTFRQNLKQADELQKLVLSATADNSGSQLYWFVDDGYIGHTQGKQTLDWVPKESGSYKIRVVDETGQSDSRNVIVQVILDLN